MAINVSQPFHRTSANAIDDTLTLTKAQMLAINDNLMPSKYLTICQEDGKIYLYDKAATPNVETGKFSVFEGGESLPSGGTTGQLLAKKSSTDGDVEWKTVEGLDPVQVDIMPIASIDELGKIYQYVGADSNEADLLEDATNDFVGEGTANYRIDTNAITLFAYRTGDGKVKYKNPISNAPNFTNSLRITASYVSGSGSAYVGFVLGSTLGSTDLYQSPNFMDMGRGNTRVYDIDLSEYNAEEIYLSFLSNCNSGDWSVTVTDIEYSSISLYKNGYFYKCVSDGESTPTYSWDEIPVQEIPPSNETISLEDFNALTQEEKDNGTAYYIYDAEAMSNFTVMGNRFDKANIYTEDERMIGSYLGKPLYQKTFNGSYSISSTPEVINDIQVTDAEKLISVEFVSDGGVGGSRYMFAPLSAGFTNENKLRCSIVDSSTRTINMITLQYTKTTDGTVNIGTGNDYSTDEQIIGTWIDGKPLYQKVLMGEDVVIGGIPLISNADELVDFRCNHTPNNSDTDYHLLSDPGMANNQGNAGGFYPRIVNDDIVISLWGGSYNGTIYWAIFQYTKTTD